MINKIKEMYKQQGISEQVYDFSEKICADLEERFKKVDKIAEYNQLKVIGAMQKNKVAEAHFNTTTRAFGATSTRSTPSSSAL